MAEVAVDAVEGLAAVNLGGIGRRVRWESRSLGRLHHDRQEAGGRPGAAGLGTRATGQQEKDAYRKTYASLHDRTSLQNW